MKTEFYPLRFHPILRERIWGGTKLKTILNKPITSDITGESWELSSVDKDISIVANGSLLGKSLNEVTAMYPDEILGIDIHKRFGRQFPLLFKFLDARDDLSIQVHPNDELAQKRHNSFGKTEMWYVMQADDDSEIIVGFSKKSSPAEFMENLDHKTLPSLLEKVKAKKGDVFFLETGTIHAIGAGILIAEIQQTSDITYRVYDWDRTDAEGKSRELHLDLAIDAMNYDVIHAQKIYAKAPNQSNPVVQCPYFTTDFLPLDGKVDVRKSGESFTVYMCTEGSVEIESGGENHKYSMGDTILIPAALKEYSLSGNASLLEIYIS
jgi:mannose-6-phosphate isomerase